MQRWLPAIFVLGIECVTGALIPLAGWIAVTIVSGAGLLWYHWGDLQAAWRRFRSAKRQAPATMAWQEFDVLPLKYAACMWHGFPPSESSLQQTVVQEELARLVLAVKQRKLEHRLGDNYHGMRFLLDLNPVNDQFTRAALAKYAKAAGRELPPFLRSGSS